MNTSEESRLKYFSRIGKEKATTVGRRVISRKKKRIRQALALAPLRKIKSKVQGLGSASGKNRVRVTRISLEGISSVHAASRVMRVLMACPEVKDVQVSRDYAVVEHSGASEEQLLSAIHATGCRGKIQSTRRQRRRDAGPKL